jgi:hypothetical protein
MQTGLSQSPACPDRARDSLAERAVGTQRDERGRGVVPVLLLERVLQG